MLTFQICQSLINKIFIPYIYILFIYILPYMYQIWLQANETNVSHIIVKNIKNIFY